MIVAVAVAALAIPSSALANAAPANQTPGAITAGFPGWIGTTQGGKNQTTTQYSASYDLFGPVTCRGVHLYGKNFPGFGVDSFTCTSTTGSPLVGVSPGQVIPVYPFTWLSDYWGLLGGYAPGGGIVPGNTQTFNFTVSSDGMSVSAVAVFY
jgi:hypothetical protein